MIRECKKNENMKTKALLIFFFVFTSDVAFVFGQVKLCDRCATSIVKNIKDTKCCEKCTKEFFITSMQANIERISPCKYLDNGCNNFMPTDKTIIDSFFVNSITEKEGFTLNDNDKIVPTKFFMISLKPIGECARFFNELVLVTDDTSQYKREQVYSLKLHPYFNKNFDSYIDEKIQWVESGHTVIDIVYKRWLIPYVPLYNNYCFE